LRVWVHPYTDLLGGAMRFQWLPHD
jgi:hypothetical protein